MGGGGGPPQSNPILTYYTEWADRTPYVTRTSSIALVTIWVVSFFINFDDYLGNIPYFTVTKFEIYRIFLSFLVGNSLLMLVFALMLYAVQGQKMEAAYGSSYFLYLILMFAICVNVVFTVFCILMYYLGSPEFMFYHCSGFWIVLFAFITLECLANPDMPRRMMCIPVEVPSLYYPWALFALLSLLQCKLSGGCS
jgi:membrane associated rhomboid family serine protease